MRLTQRLLVGSLGVIGVLVISILLVVDFRLRAGLLAEARRELEREARVVAALWTSDSDPQMIAHSAARALQHRVTLLLPNGHALGDSELEPSQIADGGDFRQLTEVAAALRDSVGWDIGRTPTGDELRVAVLAPQGVVRVTYDLSDIGAAFDSARRGLVGAGLASMALAALIAWLFARAVVRPVVELRDVARSLAAGDLSRRPSLAAPGEVGDLANALNRLAEQLSARVDALKAEEALLGALSEALSEGVVAVDRRPQVVRINATGRRLLRVADQVPFPVDHLPRERALRDALAAALRGEATDAAEAIVGGHTLILPARPLPEGGAVLALYDLTQIRKLEAVRRDFVANVSHELRTPLTIVGGFAETLAEADLPAGQR
ncbi:MAG: HAMP domain-containing protein, partial [Gemmatimonadaceae bacterium]